MPIYSYSALDTDGKTVTGKVEADNTRAARQAIKDMGYLPTKLYSDSSAAENENQVNKKISNYLQALTLKEKMDFTSTFQTLQRAGIPVIEALIFMEQDAGSRRIRMLAREVRSQVIAGSTFSDTIARFPNIFGAVYIGLVKAGEESGEMERTLDRLIELMKKEAETRGKVFSALSYPVFVVILAHLVVLIMLIFVFPAFKEMFENQDKALPWITSMMIGAGDFLKQYWFTIPIFIAAIVAFCIVCAKWKPAREILDKVVLKIPLLNNLILYSNYSNFLSVLSVSYDAGIPIVDCLHLSVITLENSVMRSKINSAIVKVQQGLQVSQALKSTKIVPRMLLFMISTGEQSGRLGDMLEKGVNFLDKTLDTIIDTMTKMIEPIMLLVIGTIVLVMALSLYLPLFQSYMQ